RDLGSAHREIALIAITLLARENPPRAGELAERLDPALTPHQRGVLWGRLGEIATMKLLPQAQEWFRRAGPELAPEAGFSRSGETLEWQARTATDRRGRNCRDGGPPRIRPGLEVVPARSARRGQSRVELAAARNERPRAARRR